MLGAKHPRPDTRPAGGRQSNYRERRKSFRCTFEKQRALPIRGITKCSLKRTSGHRGSRPHTCRAAAVPTARRGLGRRARQSSRSQTMPRCFWRSQWCCSSCATRTLTCGRSARRYSILSRSRPCRSTAILSASADTRSLTRCASSSLWRISGGSVSITARRSARRTTTSTGCSSRPSSSPPRPTTVRRTACYRLPRLLASCPDAAAAAPSYLWGWQGQTGQSVSTKLDRLSQLDS